MITASAERRVVVGMSGGVDSSVAAALLKEEGYDVMGVMLSLWSDQGVQNRCCAPEAQQVARRIARLLEIPFYVMDARDAFFREVVQPFIQVYTQGNTPNPCLNCNRHIRWTFLLERAKALGASWIATGHYARIEKSPQGKYQLLTSLDHAKDQSYFLHVLDQKQLSHTLLPLAQRTKAEVRLLAAKFGLPVADRPDSQDLCFVGQGNYRDFLRKTSPSLVSAGPILDLEGKLLGQHSGLADYTIGQRKGLGVSSPEPLYVVDKLVDSNTLIVSHKEDLGKTDFRIFQTNWISGEGPAGQMEAEVKIRFQSRRVGAVVIPEGLDQAQIHLQQPQPDITPGQAAVFYQGDLCLGGGIICREEL
jgi:tRNA-specific 2-thiouridylase